MDTITEDRPRLRQQGWLTILRIMLGGILIWKGINFIRDASLIKSLIEKTGVGFFSQYSATLGLIVTILTLLCGLFITIGLFTRAVSIVQIPILLVAIFFVNIKNAGSNSFELILTIIVLILLILFAIKGSGAVSADEYFHRGADFDRQFFKHHPQH